MKHLFVHRRQPRDEAVIDHVHAHPQAPDRQRTLKINALEELAPIRLRGGLRIDRTHHRRTQHHPATRCIVLEHLHDLVRFGDTSLRREPARRFGHEVAQRNRQHRRHQADDEHRLPAIDRHQEIARHAREHESNREDHFVEQEEPSTLFGPDELVDVRARDRDFAPRADTLQEAKGHHRHTAPGKETRDVHRHEQHDGDHESLEPPKLLRDRSKDHRAEELTHVARGDDQADLGRGELPFGDERWHREGDREYGVGVEERGDAHDDANEHQPWRDRQTFQARDNMRVVRGVRGNGGGAQGRAIRGKCCHDYLLLQQRRSNHAIT